jgi:hypothetical protein
MNWVNCADLPKARPMRQDDADSECRIEALIGGVSPRING